MNEYIITEEQLKSVIDLTEEMCETPGWIINIQPIAQRRMDIIRAIRSHPYNPQAEQGLWTADELIQHEEMAADAEREKVLDDYCKWDDTHWTTQRIKEYKKSLRNGGRKWKFQN